MQRLPELEDEPLGPLREPRKRACVEGVHALQGVLERSPLEGRGKRAEVGEEDVRAHSLQERGNRSDPDPGPGQGGDIAEVHEAARFKRERDEGFGRGGEDVGLGGGLEPGSTIPGGVNRSRSRGPGRARKAARSS